MKRIANILNPKILLISFVVAMTLAILLVLTKGNIENGKFRFQGGRDTSLEGPMELSNSSSRYVLTQAIVEKHSLLLSLDQAKVASPDVVSYKGNLFSVFTPGVSFLGVPFYIVGKYIGTPQLSAFLLNIFLAVLNLILIMRLSRKLGANIYASLLSGFVFVFATNALGYALSFTQHQASTAFILLALQNALGKRNILNNILFGIILGAGAFMDIPNVIFMLPMVIFILARHINIIRSKRGLKINARWIFLWIIIGFVPLVAFFGWYNFQLAASPFKLAQNIGRNENISAVTAQNKETPNVVVDTRGKPLLRLPFQTRSMLNGFYILVLSDERSWLFYSPVLLIGFGGLIFAYRKKQTSNAATLVIAVSSLIFVLYSMFGDPWGGWSFGARYLIPAAALLAASTGVFLTRLRKNYLVMVLFLVLFSYSVYVNTLGALTTNAIPPKVEAVNFNPPLEYTYSYNLTFVSKNESSALIYNSFLKDKVSLKSFLYLLSGGIITLGILQYLFLFRGKENYDN